MLDCFSVCSGWLDALFAILCWELHPPRAPPSDPVSPRESQKVPPTGMLCLVVIGATLLANPYPNLPRLPRSGVSLELTFTRLHLATFRELRT